MLVHCLELALFRMLCRCPLLEQLAELARPLFVLPVE
jgi:hypothetical protein